MTESTMNSMVLFDEAQRDFERVGPRRFRKDAVRVGSFVHPKTGQAIEVTPERMASWAGKFAEMKAAGIEVPFPYDHSLASRDNAGFVQEMSCEDDALFFVVDVPKEEDAENMGATIREVSVSITPHFVDGTGRRWGEVIDHIAPCTYPVVGGQGNFQELPIAARRIGGMGDRATVYFRERKESDMDKSKLAELLGLKPEEIEDDSTAQIEGAITRLRGDLDAAQKESQDRGDQVVALRRQLAAPAPAEKSPEVEAVEAELRRVNGELADGKIAKYLEQGKLTPAMVEAGDAKALLLGQRITLSINGEDGSVREAFERFMDALPEGACLDMTQRAARLRRVDRPADGLTEEKADELAQENLRLIGQGK